MADSAANERDVTLIDFTTGEVSKITTEKANARMREQEARGVRMTGGGSVPMSRKRWRALRIEARRCVCDGCYRRYVEGGGLDA